MLFHRLYTVTFCAAFALISGASPVTPTPFEVAIAGVIKSISEVASNPRIRPDSSATRQASLFKPAHPGPYAAWIFRSQTGEAGYLLFPVFADSIPRDEFSSTRVKVLTASGRQDMTVQKFFNTVWVPGKFWAVFTVLKYDDFYAAVERAENAISRNHLTSGVWFDRVWSEFERVESSLGAPASVDTGEKAGELGQR
ncbi:MAG: hypothetical protein M1829_005844 [Trizodia sp. TS-e1964]|nr:MAG: hypothetical protein M1829_005844 [Trizodia sp. TS-e1964]